MTNVNNLHQQNNSPQEMKNKQTNTKTTKQNKKQKTAATKPLFADAKADLNLGVGSHTRA